jgi:S1-C subfamily serine protease
MKRVTLYSRSSRSHSLGRASASGPEPRRPNDSTPPAANAPAVAPRRKRFFGAVKRLRWVAAAVALIALGALSTRWFLPPARPVAQADIDAAVLHTLQTKPLPSRGERAYEKIRPSVVRVRGLRYTDTAEDLSEASVGSGVVIVDNGLILTNLHVVSDAERVEVVFVDGSESEATVVGVRPEQDLAVLWASSVPDDLQAATLRPARDLSPGEDVVAVGFPFGIGPSVSRGVVSGLQREYRSRDGSRSLSNLIQFDAAVNPGSSGGPLVDNEGEVVGIVTSVLNPVGDNFFVGIGFAVPIENAASAAGISPF